MNQEFIDLEVRGTALRIATMQRQGPRAPVVFLHGFGSTKEDFADIVRFPQFADHAVLAFDAPGCGMSECANLSAISIPFLREVATRVMLHYDVSEFHLVGHSMGGLTALILADSDPSTILSFVNIEGNLHPDDCFLSRHIIGSAEPDPEQFMVSLVARIRRAPEYSCPLYASSLPHKVRAAAVAPIFRSMIELSDSGKLLERFVRLPCPTLFLYGEDSQSLSYLGCLQDHGVRLAQIPFSGHFPMYANPVAMWAAIADFIKQSEAERLHE